MTKLHDSGTDYCVIESALVLVFRISAVRAPE